MTRVRVSSRTSEASVGRGTEPAQVQAASALVNARYTLVFQQTLMSYYTGELEPERVRFGD